MQSSLLNFYTRYILSKPIYVILALLGLFAYLGYNAKDFRIDASADSLILENDQDYKYYRKISKTYGSHSYMFITYKPKGDLFSPETLNKLSALRTELRNIKHVASVLTILDVPLLRNPPVSIKELIANVKNLENPDVDLQLARSEMGSSPIYRELLVSSDLKMTALMVNLTEDVEYDMIVSRRNDLKQKLRNNTIIPAERLELEQLRRTYRECKIRLDKERHSVIAAVRKTMDGYRQDSELFLGGMSMITDDLITFVKHDLKVFGIGIIIFLIITLGIIFRKVRWVVLPILCCTFSVLAMIGLLGIFGWEVTVISSNFVSLQLIITMALTIHLIVRFREIQSDNPEWSQRELVKETVFSKFIPCLYTTLTTIAGFGSLLICDILPVINFGLMMSVGLVVSLIVTFFLFPAILCLLPKGKSGEDRQFGGVITHFLANVTQNYAKTVFIVTGLLIVMIGVGISRITVENSFIDYFRESTEIHQGLKVIDQNMGGTTPLDILVSFQEEAENSITDEVVNTSEDSDDEFSEFDEFDEFGEEEDSDKYWFTSDKMATIMKVHDYLESLPEIGKVLSLGTMLKIAEEFTEGKPLDDFQLALLYTQLPDKFKNMVITPYISIPDSQARLTVRIKDSLEGLKRDNLLNKIKSDMEGKLGLQKSQFHLAGMMVLYNNMLQSLFSSQILTIGFVVLALMVMFTVLFRSIKIALIAIVPNVISAVSVLGVMGLAGLPLDFITITIAAISIGIAVDDTIHYIHRFQEEFETDRDYMASMHRCHGSIGNAMYYTSLTIIAGFSILVCSYFIPTILFGILTGFAMLIALVTALTLLPRLIILIKPFGK
ncbi:MAG: MMPL family transporter [Candidatus Brocadiaceae bacterium]|nr:MMPL family transporter [Candidatus Brocadiaceae bacterium]